VRWDDWSSYNEIVSGVDEVSENAAGCVRPVAEPELVLAVEVACYNGVVRSVQIGGEIRW